MEDFLSFVNSDLDHHMTGLEVLKEDDNVID